MFCNFDSAVEYMFNCTPSCSEACSTLLGWLVKLMVLQSWHCLRLPFSGMGIITSDLVHSICYFSVPRSSDIDLLVFFTVPSKFHTTTYQFRGDVVHSRLLACFYCCFYFPFSTGGLSSLSLVCSMEPSVSSSQLYTSPQYHAHLISTPTSSVISLLSLNREQLISAGWFWGDNLALL